MIAVIFFGFDSEKRKRIQVGQITWDRKALYAVGSPAVHNALNEPVYLNGGKTVSKKEPEKFLRSMFKHYRSLYFNAGLAVES